MKKQHLTLTTADRDDLEILLAKGSLPVKTFKRATALLELDRGKSLTDVATTLATTIVTVAAWRDKVSRLWSRLSPRCPALWSSHHD